MSARAIVAGVLAKPPIRKTSSKGNGYLLATIREGKGDDARYWTAFIFNETVIAQVEQMQAGEPIAAAGEFTADLYRPEGKEARISYKIMIDGVLSARRPPKETERARRSDQQPVNHGRDFDDAIPF